LGGNIQKIILKNLDSRGPIVREGFNTGIPVTSTSTVDKAFPFSPIKKVKIVSFPSISRKWTVKYLPPASGSALIRRIFEGQPVIKDPSQLLSPVPDPGRILVRYGIRHPQPNLVAKLFDISEELVR
jgi:hypothetical protein